jgi:integrase
MIGTPRFQNGSLTLVKNKKAPGTWYFRFYEERNGQRTYRRQRIGTTKELPTRRDAERAALTLRVNVNSAIRTPETVSELISHYKKHELDENSEKSSSTRSAYTLLLKSRIEPKWGTERIDRIRAVDVEQWLRSLDYAPGSKSKIKNIMSAVFAHAKRYGMIPTNPIQGARCSAKRLREPDVLTPIEFKRLVDELPLRERVMVLLAGTTGLRRSELFALTWHDVDFATFQIAVNKSCVHGRIGETKTAASARPVPLHPGVANALREWKHVTEYRAGTDFLFPSVQKNGLVPVWPDTLLKKVIRPAVKRAGITGKIVGWHTFRHSLGTNLRALGVDVKVAQELLRHANAKITLDLYTQAISSQKREANERLVEMLLPSGEEVAKTQHHSAPLEGLKEEVLSLGC